MNRWSIVWLRHNEKGESIPFLTFSGFASESSAVAYAKVCLTHKEELVANAIAYVVVDDYGIGGYSMEFKCSTCEFQTETLAEVERHERTTGHRMEPI